MTAPHLPPIFQVGIEPQNLVMWLQEEGFSRAVLRDELVFVRLLNQRLSVVHEWEPIEYLLNALKVLPAAPTSTEGHVTPREEFLDCVISKRRAIQGYLDSLEIVEVKPLRDTENERYFVFKNGVCVVSAITDTKGRRVEVKLRPYEPCETFWDADVIPHDLTLEDNKSKGEFAQFISLTQGGEPERIKSLRSAIGYLLCTHKKRSEAVIVALTDEFCVGGVASGRTGKSLVCTGIARTRQTQFISGEKLDYNHAWEGVLPQHTVVVMDDMASDFNVSKLNSRATNVFEINGKGSPIVRLPYEEAPKMVGTSNHALGDFGSTYRGRFAEYIFGNHFNERHSVADEFKHDLLTKEWGSTNWNEFYNYMVGCSVIHLSDGCIRHQQRALTSRKLCQTTSDDFVGWMDQFMSHAVPGMDYSRGTLWERLLATSRDLHKDADRGVFTQKQFSRWVREWVAANDKTWNLDSRDRSRVLVDGVRPRVFVFHRVGEADPVIDPEAPCAFD